MGDSHLKLNNYDYIIIYCCKYLQISARASQRLSPSQLSCGLSVWDHFEALCNFEQWQSAQDLKWFLGYNMRMQSVRQEYSIEYEEQFGDASAMESFCNRCAARNEQYRENSLVFTPACCFWGKTSGISPLCLFVFLVCESWLVSSLRPLHDAAYHS